MAETVLILDIPFHSKIRNKIENANTSEVHYIQTKGYSKFSIPSSLATSTLSGLQFLPLFDAPDPSPLVIIPLGTVALLTFLNINHSLDPHSPPTIRSLVSPFTAEVLERWNQGCCLYFSSCAFLCPLQLEYYLHHSTKTAFVKVTKDHLVAKSSGHFSVLILLDLPVVFNTADHSLLAMLSFSWFPVTPTFPGFFSDLRTWIVLVFFAGFYFSALLLQTGVHPGSIQGLLCFFIYTFFSGWLHQLPWLVIPRICW